MIEKYLHLEDVEEYTGHSFRRTSATILADAGADTLMLKRHGGCRSSTVVEGYIENSISNKRKIGDLISTAIESTASTSIVDSIASTSSVEEEPRSSLIEPTVEVLSQSNVVNIMPSRGLNAIENPESTDN